jgi:hypothetical protein
MKIFLLALVFATAATPGADVPLLPAAKCEAERDARQCAVAQPKDWSPEERRVVQDALDRLMANELVRGIVAGAQANGYAGLRRYATDTKVDAAFGRVPKFSPGFVLFNAKIIGITDGFFETAHLTDPLSGYRFGDLILLHELIHAFDDRSRSIDAGFTSRTGWTFRQNRWVYGNPVSVSAYNQVVADTLTLYGRARYSEAWARDRSFATTMTFPLPSIQSLAFPSESFADILSHLILDPRASSYLEPAVVRWFEETVYPVLRSNARRFTIEQRE